MLVLEPNRAKEFLESPDIKYMVQTFSHGRQTLNIRHADDMLTIRQKLDEIKMTDTN